MAKKPTAAGAKSTLLTFEREVYNPVLLHDRPAHRIAHDAPPASTSIRARRNAGAITRKLSPPSFALAMQS